MPELRQSIAQHYHERTKYDPQRLASRNQELDWSKQPVPFKEYKIGSAFDLRSYLQEQSEPNTSDSDIQWWQRLSRLLFCSYGLTARMPSLGSAVYLRAAPSAGGLYPAEVYLVSRGMRLLAPGLYNYQCRTHSLMHYWESNVWDKLQQACFSHPALESTELALIITAVFYRSAWRYEDRAYRRIFLDTGHLLGNIELAGAANYYRPHLIGGFVDEMINELLYIDVQQEGALVVVPLADLLDTQQHLPAGRTTLPSATEINYPYIPDGELLTYFHQCTQIKPGTTGNLNLPEVQQEKSIEDKYNFPFCQKISMVTTPILWGEKLQGLNDTILKRRSTRAYSGDDLNLDELKALLDFTYQPQNYVDQGLDDSTDYFDLNLIETFIAVSGVKGLDAGCYYYAPKAQELRQIRFKNFRRELHFLCLGQDLGRDAAAVLFHTADLKSAVAQYGDRVYRYLHMDAGHLGQRLNLAAIHLGLGVSGIGGFFDDQVNQVLGIPDDEAVLYITTLGRPR
ncbi:SagB/ThcOx family dehydrogenase [Aetokthonos hydrillicola Thurmond2011]|jgi:SagB-type dehydrogenase family enzyme|uniref:SagB/ThcOx family dehydrogenase n=1 Tax=Aetokthonos hydrillicola Thurmond2011 TaxID=2712845 RepID=A0AAP5I549_9CYAN|nr:SagB/ThcOx family dehydrogenase [Aetokthonos hydrillicola]MBO3458980.1 SagB/ThcOx family dehydrogenase [Aetokthonos hydrillicola CCALA 1050]MBW4589088.1 SagB/ThcOx family dehydrogenase [Aetokthonos hydrillicola CCALA 1050]MDR9894956.1 SagB/ThcOx family dehydrogenase [Aetokthonos hydrillicola Thurmond2011]